VQAMMIGSSINVSNNVTESGKKIKIDNGGSCQGAAVVEGQLLLLAFIPFIQESQS